MKKVMILTLLIALTATAFAQDSGSFESQERKVHNFAVAGPEGCQLELRIYVNGDLVARNMGIFHGGEALPDWLDDPAMFSRRQAASTRLIWNGITFDGYTEKMARNELTIQGTLLTPEGEAYTLFWQTTEEDIPFIFDSYILINDIGDIAVQIAYG